MHGDVGLQVSLEPPSAAEGQCDVPDLKRGAPAHLAAVRPPDSARRTARSVAGVPSHQRGGHGLFANADADAIVPLHHVVSDHDDAGGGPDDARRGEGAARLYTGDADALAAAVAASASDSSDNTGAIVHLVSAELPAPQAPFQCGGEGTGAPYPFGWERPVKARGCYIWARAMMLPSVSLNQAPFIPPMSATPSTVLRPG